MDVVYKEDETERAGDEREHLIERKRVLASELEAAGIHACCIMESIAQMLSYGSNEDWAHTKTLLNEAQDLRSALDAARSDDSEGETK